MDEEDGGRKSERIRTGRKQVDERDKSQAAQTQPVGCHSNRFRCSNTPDTQASRISLYTTLIATHQQGEDGHEL